MPETGIFGDLCRSGPFPPSHLSDDKLHLGHIQAYQNCYRKTLKKAMAGDWNYMLGCCPCRTEKMPSAIGLTMIFSMRCGGQTVTDMDCLNVMLLIHWCTTRNSDPRTKFSVRLIYPCRYAGEFKSARARTTSKQTNYSPAYVWDPWSKQRKGIPSSSRPNTHHKTS